MSSYKTLIFIFTRQNSIMNRSHQTDLDQLNYVEIRVDSMDPKSEISSLDAVKRVNNSPENKANDKPPPSYFETHDDSEASKDYVMWSVFNILFCFVLIGFVALIFSIRTKKNLSRGNLTFAKRSSIHSFRLNLIATVTGSLLYTAVLTYLFLIVILIWTHNP